MEKNKNLYESPEAIVMTLGVQGVLCASTEPMGEDEMSDWD